MLTLAHDANKRSHLGTHGLPHDAVVWAQILFSKSVTTERNPHIGP